MKYCSTLVAVRDMEKSLHFYKNLFNQEVAVDLGWCKTLTCGLTLQEHFNEVAGFAVQTAAHVIATEICATAAIPVKEKYFIPLKDVLFTNAQSMKRI